MKDEILLHILLAMREQIDAAVQLLAPAEPAPCPHPPADRIDDSTMGRISWRCGLCGFQFAEKVTP